MHTHVDVVLALNFLGSTGPKLLLPSGCVSCQNVWAATGSYLSLPCGGGGVDVTFKIAAQPHEPSTTCTTWSCANFVSIDVRTRELTKSTCRS